MADVVTKKKSSTQLFTHWARPRVRTYDYNNEYRESYYRPMVQYISTSRALTESSSSYSSSSSVQLESSTSRRERLLRRRRAASPPGALSFIERWSYEPFYGYGIGFRSRHYRASSEQLTSSSSLQSSSSSLLQSTAASVERSRRELSRARSVALDQHQSELRQQSSIDTNRSRRARSIDIVSRYASDDCLMRSTALNSAAAAISARARSASRDIMDTQSLTSKTLRLDDRNVLHGRTLDDRYYLDYPKQHLVCPPGCPLHNSPEWRRRFLIGNRFLDAAALGGFDVLYDPTVYRNSRRLLAKLAERSEYDTEEISIERNIDSESSRRRVRATASMA